MPTHRRRPFDCRRFSTGPLPTTAPNGRPAEFRFAVVPGFTPRWWHSSGLADKAIARLELGLAALESGRAASLIVSGGAVHSDENEALLMRDWLLARGVEPTRVVVEPCARHTTTNLRNAGRIVLSAGAREALVVTGDQQAYHLGRPWLFGFHGRCLVELGYLVGELERLDPHHLRFRPSPDVFRDSWKESFMGDP